MLAADYESAEISKVSVIVGSFEEEIFHKRGSSREWDRDLYGADTEPGVVVTDACIEGRRNFQKAIEAGLIERGYRVVDRSLMDKIMEEQSLSVQDITEDSGRIGELLNADALFLFEWSEYRDVNSDDSLQGTVTVLGEMVSVSTGETLYHVNIHVTDADGFDFKTWYMNKVVACIFRNPNTGIRLPAARAVEELDRD